MLSAASTNVWRRPRSGTRRLKACDASKTTMSPLRRSAGAVSLLTRIRSPTRSVSCIEPLGMPNGVTRKVRTRMTSSSSAAGPSSHRWRRMPLVGPVREGAVDPCSGVVSALMPARPGGDPPRLARSSGRLPQQTSSGLLRRGLGRAGLRGDGVALLADLGSLAAQTTQVVELRAAHVTTADDLDVVDDRRVQREGALDADAERDLADGEGLADAAAVATDDDALEDLDTRARALDDLDVDLEGVAGAEVGNVRAQ